RSFLSTAHAIINVHEREIIIRQDQQSLKIQCGDIPSIKKVQQINKIDFIDAGGIDFESEEIENFLNDDSIPFGVEDSPFNMDEDILFLERLLIEEPSPPHPIILNQTKLPIEEPKNLFKMGSWGRGVEWWSGRRLGKRVYREMAGKLVIDCDWALTLPGFSTLPV
nr:hypothetical protein [Tanacetum cinerariifolium]